MPGTTLTNSGTLTYNGFSFSAASVKIHSYRADPVYDEAKRTVVYMLHTLAVSQVLQNESPTLDATVLDAKNRLGKNGGQLVISGMGLGTVSINGGAVKDVAWGPMPQSVEFEFYSKVSGVLTWVVQWAIPMSAAVTPKYRGEPMAFNYSANWSIDRYGRTTLTRAGYIEIPQTRYAVDVPGILDHVDKYRGFIQFPRIPGFERTHSFTASYDKRRMDFVITDQELATTPPAGFVDFTFDQSFQTVGGSVFKYQFQWSLSGTVGKDTSVSKLWDYFAILLNNRWKLPEDAVIPRSLSSSVRKAGGEETMTIEYAYDYIPADPTRYKKENGFNTRSVVGLVQKVLAENYYFEPLPKNIGATEASWNAEILKTQGIRGRAGLAATTADDAIVDLCTIATLDRGAGFANFAKQSAADLAKKLSAVKGPDADASWERYDIQVSVYSDSEPIVYSVTQAASGLADAVAGAAGAAMGNLAAMAQLATGLAAASSGLTVIRNPNEKWYAELNFAAVRHGFQIPSVALKNVGGAVAVPINTTSMNIPVEFTGMGGRIYRKSETRTYLLPDFAKNVKFSATLPETLDVQAQVGPPENLRDSLRAAGGFIDNVQVRGS